MRKLWKQFSLLFGTGSLILSSCNNDIPVNSEWQDIAYVYGILNPQLDTQFVRIGQAFLGDGPPSEFAQIPDSIYYKDITVFMEEFEASTNNITNIFGLERIERPGQLQPGFFTTEGFHLYYTTATLDTSKSYRLVIEKPDGGPTVTAETTLTFWRDNQNNGNVREPFTRQLAFITPLGVPNSRGINFTWNKAFNSGVHEGRLIFRYKEQDRQNRANVVSKSLVLKTVGTETSAGIVGTNISPEAFYGFVSRNIQPDPSKFRYFDTIFFEAIAGGDMMALYTEINTVGGGIVQERPSFTNVENGIGLFSSKATTVALENGRRKRFYLNENSYNALVMDLCDLNFVKISFTDSCYCDGGSVQTIGNTVGNCRIN